MRSYNKLFLISILTVFSLTFASCDGGGSSDDTGTNSDNTGNTPTQNVTPDNSFSQTIDPAGGTLTFTSPLDPAYTIELRFPAGAVDSPTIITIQDTTLYPADPDVISGTAYELGPASVVLNLPISLIVSYRFTDVATTLPADLSLNTVVNNNWQQSASTTNVNTQQVSTSTGSLGTWAILKKNPARDQTAPTVSIAPSSTSWIPGNTAVVLSFSESMEPASFNATGTLVATNVNYQWSTTNFNNDTLRILPQTVWSNGNGQTLVVGASDLSGNPISPLQVNYNVDASIPTASSNPSSGASILSTEPIRVQFSTTMETNSLVLTGSFSLNNYTVAWQDTATLNDTLLITPITAWATGLGTLLIKAQNLSAVATPQVTLSFTVDAIAPLISYNIPDLSWISGTLPVVVQFSESVNPASLQASGSLTKATTQAVWSTRLFPNDTLTLSPQTTWNQGSQDLTIQVSDVAGNPALPTNVTVIVDKSTPSAVVQPAAGSSIGVNQPIVILYNTSMQPASLVSQGSLLAQGNSSVWSQTVVPQDTLTFTAITTWAGGNQNIQVSVNSMTGLPVIIPATTSFMVDATPPTATLNPASGNLDPFTAIKVTFSETIDTVNVVLGGSLLAAGQTVQWSTTSLVNDTVTILPPANGWPVGTTQQLTLVTPDIYGNSLMNQTGSPDVDVFYDVVQAQPAILAFYPTGVTGSETWTILANEQIASVATSGKNKKVKVNITYSQTVRVNDTAVVTPQTNWSTKGKAGVQGVVSFKVTLASGVVLTTPTTIIPAP